jgi:L-rhamnose mutarotase
MTHSTGSTRRVLLMTLKDDPVAIDAYRRYHLDVWPEVLCSLRQAGVEHMEIHLLGRFAVMIVEMASGVDYRAALLKHASSNGRVAEWERLMRTLQEPAAGGNGERWAFMEPIFYMDEQEPAIVRLAEPPRAS